VLTKPDGSIKYMMIFDYGSHKKFKASVNKSMCFDDFAKLVHGEFYRSVFKSEYNLAEFPNGSGIMMYEPKTGQARRSNAAMLSGINYLGNPIRHNTQTYNTTLMTRMSTRPRNLVAEVRNRQLVRPTRKEAREMIRNSNQKIPKLERRYFMSRANLNKVLKNNTPKQ